VHAAIAGSDLMVEFDEPFHGIDALQTEPDSEIVKLAERLCDRKAGAVAFGTEGPYLNALGMQTVVLGPGDIDVAHQANEYLALDRIAPMQRILEGMIRHICM
jgi:acetylornithine deacetylase